MEQLRLVDCPDGPITYILTKKRIKNWNLRVRGEDTVALSAPMGVSLQSCDQFIRAHSGWIRRALARRREEAGVSLFPQCSREEARDRLERAVDRVYPMAAALGVARPLLKLRKMRSQWGNCHWSQGYITLNVALARCPEGLRDYVALHELVHFLHHDHGPGFYARMDALMPDWRRRRQELKKYSAALESEG